MIVRLVAQTDLKCHAPQNLNQHPALAKKGPYHPIEHDNIIIQFSEIVSSVPLPSMSSTIVIQDKTPIFTAFLLPLLNAHASANPTPRSPPFFLGISGPQGSGKSTLVTTLATTLRTHPHSLNVVVFSADDLYLTHVDQVALRELYPDNKLVRHRGEPGTHDLELAKGVFQSLRDQRETRIPSYDKSAFGGQGDRADEVSWKKVDGPYDLVIFEGWCVGFRPLLDNMIEEAWNKSRSSGNGTLGNHSLEHLLFINTKLKDYDAITE